MDKTTNSENAELLLYLDILLATDSVGALKDLADSAEVIEDLDLHEADEVQDDDQTGDRQ